MGCECHHNHGHEHGDDLPEGPQDAAAQSLSDALKVSFRLLSLLMILVLVAFLATGIETIDPKERGIVKIFGRQVAVAEPGLVYNWPFPVGEIEKVPVIETIMTVKDFWMFETPAEANMELLKRPVPQGGLRVGEEGALLTGDRFLFHVILNVHYRIVDPVKYRMSSDDTESMLRSAVCNAAIKAAAKQTAEGLRSDKQSVFLTDTQEQANTELLSLMGLKGSNLPVVTITRVTLVNGNVPLAALQSYEEAQNKRSEARKIVYAASTDAQKSLLDAAGPSYRILVGEPSAPGQANDGTPGIDEGLIDQYNKALADGDKVLAAKLLDKIDETLLSNDAGGQARVIIRESESRRAAIVDGVKARVKQFELLLVEYRKSPEFLLARHWETAREEILGLPTVEKFYVNPASPMIFQIGRDAEIRKAIRRELMKGEKKAGKPAE